MTATNVVQFPRLRAVGPVNGVLTSSKAAKRHEVDASVGIAAWPPAGRPQDLHDSLVALKALREACAVWPEGDGRVAELILLALIAAEAQLSRVPRTDGAA